ncbi:MAG: TolB family protein [Sandaracinaceae bacterium]
MEIEDVDHLVHARRSPLPIVIGLSVLAGLGVAAWLFLVPSTPPAHRVLLVAAGMDPSSGPVFEERVLSALGDGFETVEYASDDTPDDLESASALALEQRAYHVVRLTYEAVEERDNTGLDPAFAYGRLGAEVATSTGEEDTVTVESIEVAGYGASIPEARAAAVRRGGEAIGNEVHRVLLTRALTQAFVEDTGARMELLTRQTELAEHVGNLETGATARERFEAHCAAGQATLEGSTCVSAGCDEHYAFAALPDGSAAVVHTETPGMRISPRDSSATPERVEAVEHIVVMPLDGSEPRVIGSASNYYTYPNLSADGSTVVAVEDWQEGFGVVAIDVASGARRLLTTFTGYPQAPKISPDGTHVLIRHRERRRGDAQTVIFPLSDGVTPRRLGRAELAEWGALTLVPDAEPTVGIVERVALDDVLPPGEAVRDEVRDTEEEGQLARLFMEERIALLSHEDGRVLAWLDDDRHRVESILGSHEGALVYRWSNRNQCGVGWWRPADALSEDEDGALGGPIRTVRTGCYRQMSVGTDGAIFGVGVLATEADLAVSDREILRIDPETGETAVLTANATRDRYPRPAGGRVVYDRVLERTYRRFPRVATCAIDASPDTP